MDDTALAEQALSIVLRNYPTLFLILNKSLLAFARTNGIESAVLWSGITQANLNFCFELGLEKRKVALIAMRNQDMDLWQHCYLQRWPWNRAMTSGLPTVEMLKWGLNLGFKPRLKDIAKWLFRGKPMAHLIPLLDPLIVAADLKQLSDAIQHQLPKDDFCNGSNQITRITQFLETSKTCDQEALFWFLGRLPLQLEHSSSLAAAVFLMAGRLEPRQIAQHMFSNRTGKPGAYASALYIAEATQNSELLDLLLAHLDSLPVSKKQSFHSQLLSVLHSHAPLTNLTKRFDGHHSFRWSELAHCNFEYLEWAQLHGGVWDEFLIRRLIYLDQDDLLEKINQTLVEIPPPRSSIKQILNYNSYQPIRPAPRVLEYFMKDTTRWAAWLCCVPICSAILVGRIDFLKILLDKHQAIHTSDILAGLMKERFDMLILMENKPLLKDEGYFTLSRIYFKQIKASALRCALRTWFKQPLLSFVLKHSIVGKKPNVDFALLEAGAFLNDWKIPPTGFFPYAWIGDSYERLRTCILDYGLRLVPNVTQNLILHGRLDLLEELSLQANSFDDAMIMRFFRDSFILYGIDLAKNPREALKELEEAWIYCSTISTEVRHQGETHTQRWIEDRRIQAGMLGLPVSF